MTNIFMQIATNMKRYLNIIRKWMPWKKWLYIRKIRKDASNMEQRLDFIKNKFEWGLCEECKDRIEYKNSIDDFDKLFNGIFLINMCEVNNISNIVGFMTLGAMDLYTIYAHLLESDNIIEKNFFSRLICMNMYEFTEDILQLLGKDKNEDTGRMLGVRQMVNDIEDDKLIAELNKLRSKWKDFWNEIARNGKNYSSIRNITVAHKDHIFLKQYNSLKTIQYKQVIEDFEKFKTIYKETETFIGHFMIKNQKLYKKKMNKIIEDARSEVDKMTSN